MRWGAPLSVLFTFGYLLTAGLVWLWTQSTTAAVIVFGVGTVANYGLRLGARR